MSNPGSTPPPRKRPAAARPVYGGMRAKYATDCARCPDLIAMGAPMRMRHGRPIHPGCAPGADDE